MENIVIRGRKRLKGEIITEGAKNSALPILAATILNGGLSVIHNCPNLTDINFTIQILKKLGCKVKLEENNTVIIDSSSVNQTKIPEKLATTMRSSIIFLGPMLARFRKVTISYPGGCDSLWVK